MFVLLGGQHDQAHLRITPAHDGDDLEPVHARHRQIHQDQIVGFGFEHRHGPTATDRRVNDRFAGQRF